MESQPDSNTIQSFNASNGGGMQDLVIGIWLTANTLV
jgi:hypothetical protein